MHFMGERIFGFGIALQDYSQQAFATDNVINQFSALRSFNQQGGDHSRKNDDVGQTQNREGFRQGP
jgi:hypothetical protein